MVLNPFITNHLVSEFISLSCSDPTAIYQLEEDFIDFIVDVLPKQRYYLLLASLYGSWLAKMKYYIKLILCTALGQMLHY